MSSTADDWYEEVKTGEPLRQGQILPNFRLVRPTYRVAGGEAEFQSLSTPVIILSQTCDLYRPEKDERGETAFDVLVAPIRPFSKIHVKNWDKLPTSKMTLYHWLPATEAAGLPYSVISFALVSAVPYNIVVEHANANRCFRLKYPYAQDLAHRFGTIFSRVALPEPPYDMAAYKKMVDDLKK